MKFRIKQNKENLYYVQVKGFLFWKDLRKDKDVIYLNTPREAELVAKEYFLYMKRKQKKDEVVKSFNIK